MSTVMTALAVAVGKVDSASAQLDTARAALDAKRSEMMAAERAVAKAAHALEDAKAKLFGDHPWLLPEPEPTVMAPTGVANSTPEDEVIQIDMTPPWEQDREEPDLFSPGTLEFKESDDQANPG